MRLDALLRSAQPKSAPQVSTQMHSSHLWTQRRTPRLTSPAAPSSASTKACCAPWRIYSSHFFSTHILARTRLLLSQGKLPNAPESYLEDHCTSFRVKGP